MALFIQKSKKTFSLFFFLLYKDLVGYYIANPGSDRRHFIVLCSERRTSISLVVNRAITYGQIKSINNQPLMDDTLVNHMPLLNTGNSDSHALNRNVLHSQNIENEPDKGFSESNSDDNECILMKKTITRKLLQTIVKKCLEISRIFKALVEDDNLRHRLLSDGKKKQKVIKRIS